MFERGEQLFPKSDWGVRRFIAWLILGPFNPASWAAIYILEGAFNIFGLVAAFTLWPCCFGAAIGLAKLKNRPVDVLTLKEFVAGWVCFVLVTFPIFLICALATYFNVAGSDSFEFAQLLAIPLVMPFALMALPFTLMYGAVPAICAGIMSYLVIRFALFRRASPPVATP